MVAKVHVFRVNNPDGTFLDFASLEEATRHEVRFGLLTAVAGFPENATEGHHALVNAILDEPERYYDLIATLIGVSKQAQPAPVATTVPQPTATRAAVATPAPRPRPASRGPGGNRGPGFTVRVLKEGEAPRGSAFGDGREEA